MASIITSGLSKLSLRGTREDDEDDNGEEIDPGSIAGGGHGARDTHIKHNLRVSQALRAFIIEHKILSEKDVGLGSDKPGPGLQALLEKPHISPPAEVTDRSYPLPDYFISSSHNTYLLAHQLYGSSCATAYESALKAGSRCVEIDAWDNKENKDEPKVTHGWTLTSNISFREVCEAIRDVHDEEAREAEKHHEAGWQGAPILLSLENHCDAHGQKRLVEIMKEVFGDRLLSRDIRKKGHEEQKQGDQHPGLGQEQVQTPPQAQKSSGEHVTLKELGSQIAVIVEYHWPDQKDDSDELDNGSEDEDEDEKQARKDYKAKKISAAPSAGIIPELSALGVYAQSVKPQNNSWYDPSEEFVGPHHHLINVSESGLASHMPSQNLRIAGHNAHHLMRVYPKGTRISSRNLKPVPFWGLGAQICALNWQTFGAAMQINEALFSGTDGYVLKPEPLREGGDGKLTSHRKKRLVLHVAGATDVPIPEGRSADDIKPYLTCTLVHPDDRSGKPPKRKTTPYKQHKLTGFLHRDGHNPAPDEPVWDEKLEWEYQDNPLVFVRMLIKSDDSWAANPMFAVAAVRLQYARDDWVFIRMLDLKGRETKCSVLVRFEIGDVVDEMEKFFSKGIKGREAV